MKEPKIRIAYISPDDTHIHDIEMEDTLENWYKIIKCELIEAHILHDDPDLLFICDESGKLKPDPKPNFYWIAGNNDIVVGTVGFCRRSGPEFASLREEDLPKIETYVMSNTVYPWKIRKENH